jgi:hypothetical protein
MSMGYELEGEPRFVRDDDSSPLPGHYEATFRTDDGVVVERYVTDKGRAALLRISDHGRRVLDEREFIGLTTAPTLEHLLAALNADGGEGG